MEKLIRNSTFAALLMETFGAVCAHAEGLSVAGSMDAPHYPRVANSVSALGATLIEAYRQELLNDYQHGPDFVPGAGDTGHSFASEVAALTHAMGEREQTPIGMAHTTFIGHGGGASGNGVNVDLESPLAVPGKAARGGVWELPVRGGRRKRRPLHVWHAHSLLSAR